MTEISTVALPDTILIAAYAIFTASYFVFALGKFPGLRIDRPGAAIIGAVAMVAFGIVPAVAPCTSSIFPPLSCFFP